MHVALAQDDQVLAVHLDLVLVLGGEEHLVADLDLPHVAADGARLAPHQPLRHLRGGGDQDAAAGAPVAVLLAERHQQAVVEHLDRESALPGSGGDVLGHADQRYPGRTARPDGQVGGGPRISTPYSCAACASAAGSTGPGSGSRRAPAGPPTAAANLSKPLGVVICSVRSGSSGPTRNECASPAGSSTKSPGPAASSSPSHRKVARPPSSRNISSSTVCRCNGGAKPGGLRNSTTVARPPVSAPVALTVTRLPRNQ